MEVAGVMEVSVDIQWLECVSIKCVGAGSQSICFLQSRAKQLHNAGYKTLTHLANADPAVLSKTIENLYRKQAIQIVASAKVSVLSICAQFLLIVNVWTGFIRWRVSVLQMLLNEKAAALQEEVDELLTIPFDLPTL